MKKSSLLLAPAVLLVAAACTTGSHGAGTGGASASVGTAAPRAATSAAAAAHGRPVALMQRQVISRGELELRARDVGRARQAVLRLLPRWDGQVATEQTGSSARGRTTSVSMVLRVPSADFAAAMTALARVAHAVHQQISTEDVTTRVIDVRARLRAKQDSIHRIEQLLARARNLGQVIAIETDLSDRQAELDSLRQQDAWLSDQTSLSTISLSITAAPAGHHARHAGSGLLAGLATGWHALGTVVVGLLTGLGVVLPFGVAAGVVVVPLWLGWRRWGRKPAPSDAPS
jgi:hypothetical protein